MKSLIFKKIIEMNGHGVPRTLKPIYLTGLSPHYSHQTLHKDLGFDL